MYTSRIELEKDVISQIIEIAHIMRMNSIVGMHAFSFIVDLVSSLVHELSMYHFLLLCQNATNFNQP